MENMAHCRFENTLAALRECESWLHEHALAELSFDEYTAAIRLFRLCRDIPDNYMSKP